LFCYVQSFYASQRGAINVVSVEAGPFAAKGSQGQVWTAASSVQTNDDETMKQRKSQVAHNHNHNTSSSKYK